MGHIQRDYLQRILDCSKALPPCRHDYLIISQMTLEQKRKLKSHYIVPSPAPIFIPSEFKGEIITN